MTTRIPILGSAIDIIASYEMAYQRLTNYLHNRDNQPSYITVNNVHTVIEGVLARDYQQITNNALMAFPDGKPLSVIARWKGAENIERIFGPTFLEKALDWGQRDGLKHFFYGGSEETLKKLLDQCQQRFPNLHIAGAISPPFRDLTPAEKEYYINQINASGADIIWVALGAPKQERWMAENYRRLDRGVMIGIGAGFDYLAGNTQHAPKWMKDFALEWLYRLIQEPGRLWKRYLVTNSLFMYYILLERLGLRRFG